jgi:Arylsulfotransferase (ASST)
MGQAPTNTLGLLWNTAEAYPGYTLFAPNFWTNTYLIDNNGRLVHTWASRFRPANSVYLLPDGHLLRPAHAANPVFFAGGAGGWVEEYDWDGNLVWSYLYSSPLHLQHHDVRRLPNGNTLLIAWEVKTAAEAIAAGRSPQSLNQNGVWPDHLIEVQPTGPTAGAVVWEWHAWDHLIQDFDPTKANYGTVGVHPELIDLNFARTIRPDWLHVNAVDYNPDLDQILLSVHNFSEVWVIDHGTTRAEAAGHSGGRRGKGGDLLYRWGNPQAYRAGSSADRRLFTQHGSNWIEPGLPGAGNILLLNNGTGRPGGNASSVDEIVPPVDAMGNYALNGGEAFGPAAPSWTYPAGLSSNFYAQNQSGAQRLPNGNTLICDGPSGAIFEVSNQGTVVWVYLNPVTNQGPLVQGELTDFNTLFRAYRYATNYPGLAGRNLQPQGPIEPYPADYFRIVTVERHEDGVTCAWRSLAGRTYQLQSRAGPDPSPWLEVATTNATGPVTAVKDSDPGRTARDHGFYRTVLLPESGP